MTQKTYTVPLNSTLVAPEFNRGLHGENPYYLNSDLVGARTYTDILQRALNGCSISKAGDITINLNGVSKAPLDWGLRTGLTFYYYELDHAELPEEFSKALAIYKTKQNNGENKPFVIGDNSVVVKELVVQEKSVVFIAEYIEY